VRQTLKRALGKPAHHGVADTFTQLTRINFAAEVAAAAQAALFNAKILHTYDIVAVQPQSEQIFNLACTTFEVDIISLDLSHRLPFKFKPAPIKAALDRDVFFEICYSPSLRESGARRQFIANCQALLRETRGGGVILSSGCRSSFEMRGPNDVINVGTFVGMTEQQARAAVSANAAAVVQHAVKRRATRGMVSIEMKGTLSGVDNRKRAAAAENDDLKEAGGLPTKFGSLGKP
jgi:ribonuclease P/MRP protein subunit RPP1